MSPATMVGSGGSEIAALTAENDDLRALCERALGEAEALKRENAELHKANQDIQLDQQLVKALNETEKLKAAADAYKKELLQQKLAEKEWDLQQALDRTKDLEHDNNTLSSTIAELRLRQQDKEAQLEHLRRENAKLREEMGSLEHASPSKSEAEVALDEGKAKEAEEIANQLQELGAGRVDTQLLVAAAKGLRDIAVLEKQLKRAREEKERLQADVAELNDTVFSKSFKAPSAWAEREVKYKMEKRDWESKVEKLRQQLRALQAENAAYRAASKTSELEEHIAVLESRLSAVEEEKVAAQKAHHDLQLQVRKGTSQVERTAHVTHVKDGVPIMQIVETLSEGGPSDGSRASVVCTPRRKSSSGAIIVDGEVYTPEGPLPLDFPSHVEGIIYDYDSKGIGLEAKKNLRDVQSPNSSRIFDTGRPADVVAGVGGPKDLQSGDALARRVAALQDEKQSLTAAGATTRIAPPYQDSPDAQGLSLDVEGSLRAAAEAEPSVSGPGGWDLPGSPSGGLPQTSMSSGGIETSMTSGGHLPTPVLESVSPQSRPPDAQTHLPADFFQPVSWEAAAGGLPVATGGMSRLSSDVDDMDWTPERLRELEADKVQVARALGDHAADNDVGSLRWRVAELESVAEMYVVQLQKMAVALERADQEKSVLEQELEAARGQKKETNFAAHAQDRLLALLSGRRPDEEVADRLREAEGMLQDSYRERGVLQRKVDSLERRLAAIACKLNAGLVPDEADLAAFLSASAIPERRTEDGAIVQNRVTATEAGPSKGGAESNEGDTGLPGLTSPGGGLMAGRRRHNTGLIAGLSEEEVEVMRLREENENLMHTVVRTKIELAETQGEYLKAKRALLRSVEKQAAMAEKLDSLQYAVADGNLAGAEQLLVLPMEKPKGLGGDIESLGERDLF